MTKIKKTLSLFILYTFLISCGVDRALAPQKKSGSEEFLVQKKTPLVMPPSYGDLPKPLDKTKKSNKKKIDIKELLTGSKIEDTENIGGSKIESLILKKISKN